MRIRQIFFTGLAARSFVLASVAVLFLTVSHANTAFASTTDGTIDTTNRYAWSENAGWIDFGSTAGNVHVTDSVLTGTAYGENAGWIILNPGSGGGVSNDGEGNLSGYAWSENAGWIDFSKVTIGIDGVFAGNAYSENLGWITFGTVNNRVSTDWRPASARSGGTLQSSGSSSHGSGGSGQIVIPAKLATQPSANVPPPAPTNVPAPTVVSFTRDLSRGAHGDDVRALQVFLNAAGFIVSANGAGSLGQETDYFGPATAAALARFQSAHNVSPASGYLGPLTRAVIASLATGGAATNSPTTAAAGAPAAWTRDLNVGIRGADVTALQGFLIAQQSGPASVALAASGATGYFGEMTRAALAEFQTAHGITPAAGYFGPKTRAAITNLGL